MINFPKPLNNPRNQFLRWLNNWLTSCISSTPKSTPDIEVRTERYGSYLYVSDAIKRRGELNYPINTNEEFLDGETLTQHETRITALITANLTDAPVWDNSMYSSSFTRGTIIRVLSQTTGDSTASYVSASAVFSGSRYSGSAIDATGKFVIPAGTYICVSNVPAYSSTAKYNYFTASGLDLSAVRNPKICYHPLYPEPSRNATYFGPVESSGSLFENYQGRYWECLSFASTGSSAGMIFKGSWSTSASYVAQNVVILSSGSNAGSYVALSTIPGTGSSYAPDIGSTYWAQLGSLNTIGKWN